MDHPSTSISLDYVPDEIISYYILPLVITAKTLEEDCHRINSYATISKKWRSLLENATKKLVKNLDNHYQCTQLLPTLFLKTKNAQKLYELMKKSEGVQILATHALPTLLAQPNSAKTRACTRQLLQLNPKDVETLRLANGSIIATDYCFTPDGYGHYTFDCYKCDGTKNVDFSKERMSYQRVEFPSLVLYHDNKADTILQIQARKDTSRISKYKLKGELDSSFMPIVLLDQILDFQITASNSMIALSKTAQNRNRMRYYTLYGEQILGHDILFDEEEEPEHFCSINENNQLIICSTPSAKNPSTKEFFTFIVDLQKRKYITQKRLTGMYHNPLFLHFKSGDTCYLTDVYKKGCNGIIVEITASQEQITVHQDDDHSINCTSFTITKDQIIEKKYDLFFINYCIAL